MPFRKDLSSSTGVTAETSKVRGGNHLPSGGSRSQEPWVGLVASNAEWDSQVPPDGRASHGALGFALGSRESSMSGLCGPELDPPAFCLGGTGDALREFEVRPWPLDDSSSPELGASGSSGLFAPHFLQNNASDRKMFPHAHTSRVEEGFFVSF